jgi:hypothetical protein
MSIPACAVRKRDRKISFPRRTVMKYGLLIYNDPARLPRDVASADRLSADCAAFTQAIVLIDVPDLDRALELAAAIPAAGAGADEIRPGGADGEPGCTVPACLRAGTGHPDQVPG